MQIHAVDRFSSHRHSRVALRFIGALALASWIGSNGVAAAKRRTTFGSRVAVAPSGLGLTPTWGRGGGGTDEA